MVQMKILSLNINCVTSKLEDRIFTDLFMKYDIVCLSELKCNYCFSVPGFMCIRSDIIKGEEKRGGVAVLLKHQVWKHVHKVKTVKDQVWFNVQNAPRCRFAAVYISPRDSLYFSQDTFGFIADQCMSNEEQIVILGDFECTNSAPREI